MGNNNSSMNEIKKKNIIIKDDPDRFDYHSNSKIVDTLSCPMCSREFNGLTSYKEFNTHLKHCGLEYSKTNKPCELYSIKDDRLLNGLIYKFSKNYHIGTNFRKEFNFKTKLNELKIIINSRKISWQEGSCELKIHRNELLKESMEQINHINLFKELKINFDGEICYDAGGIFREWFTTIFQTLEGDKLKLFIISDNDNFSYIINPFLKHNEENFNYFTFIGKLIGKAILDNITINVCFNKLIYKMILKEEITFEDLSSIHTPFYTSMKNLKKTLNSSKGKEKEICKDLEIYYNLDIKDSYLRTHKFELMKGGNKTMMKNVDDYINKRISFMKGIYEPFIQKIREGLFKIIPENTILMFKADELELIVNGKPEIELDDWKKNTVYKSPYYSSSKVIKWFWEILEGMSQKQLSNFLMFCTGTSRVPFGGFSKLESNRGEIAKFTIEYGIYREGKKNFIKAHTCFNRIDLPNYKNKKELEEALEYVSSNEILGFGID